MSPQPPRSQDAKDEGRDPDIAMLKFRTLARKLVGVSRADLDAAENAYRANQKGQLPSK